MRYLDFGVQTLLIIIMFLSYPHDHDGYIFILAMGMGPWQLLSAILSLWLTPRLRTARQVYLGVSVVYLFIFIPLATGRPIVEAIDHSEIFVVPGILAFLYYLLTIESLYNKKNKSD
jgi:hypothetical protein